MGAEDAKAFSPTRVRMIAEAEDQSRENPLCAACTADRDGAIVVGELSRSGIWPQLTKYISTFDENANLGRR